MAPKKYDRIHEASTVASIGGSSSTKGSYLKLDSSVLETHGPAYDLSLKNSMDKASIEVAEEYKPWGYPRGIKYLISMHDDYKWLLGMSGYRDTIYTGFSSDPGGSSMTTMDKLEDALNSKYNATTGEYTPAPYYMILKRAAIVPVSLPRTTRAEDFGAGEDGSKRAGFLDTNDYFRYTSGFQYYGEKGGISNELTIYADHISNRINWEYIGAINQNDLSSDDSTAGSWNTLLDSFYAVYDGEALGYGYIGVSKPSPAGALWDVEALRWAMGWTKVLIKAQTTSITNSSWTGFINDLSYKGDDDADTAVSQDLQQTKGVSEGLGHEQDDGNGMGDMCGVIGAFLYEYCGPLYSHTMLLLPDGTNKFINIGTDEAYVDEDVTLRQHAHATATLPYFDIDGWSDAGSGTFISNAKFELNSWGDLTTALEIRFGTDTSTLARANAYLEYYTGYIYERVTVDPIPREYKTKMQATPKLDPKLMTAVTGKRNLDYSSPSESGVSTATTTAEMGSSY